MAGRPMVVDTRKALAIVALVAAEGRPFARDELAAMFWPDADDEAARGALRRTLSALRTAVGDAGFEIGRAQVAIDAASASVDLADFERLAASSATADLEAAASLARGPFLAGFALRDSPTFDDWQVARATRVERSLAALLDRLGAARLAGGDVAGAVEAASRRVELDPLDELGQRRLIELLAAVGDRSGAIRQYRELVALFDRELGVAPLHETTDLYDAIREDRFAPDRSIDVPAAVTPTPAPDAEPDAIPFVGRDRELAVVVSAWRASEREGRVALLEGEAGIGKTRLTEVLAATVRAGGGIVLAARGYPGEGAIAYGPVAESPRAGLATPEARDGSRSLDETTRADLGASSICRWAPAGGVGPVDRPRRTRRARPTSRGHRRRVDGSRPAQSRARLDRRFHLADEATREAVAYLARRLAGRSVLLLLTWRREELDAGGESTADGLARLPVATTVILGRLSRDAVAELVRAVRPADADDDGIIDAFIADSEGLPLHVVEALASGEPPGRRCRGVSMPCSRTSQVGRRDGDAGAVSGGGHRSLVRPRDGPGRQRPVRGGDRRRDRGVDAPRHRPGGAGRRRTVLTYDFVHGRMRDVAYEATSLARRRLLHRRAGAASGPIRVRPVATT